MTSISVLNPATEETIAELAQAGIEAVRIANDTPYRLSGYSEIKNVYYSTEV